MVVHIESQSCVDIIVCMYVCEMKFLSRHRSAHCDVIYCITSIRGKERHGWNDMRMKYFEGGEEGGGVGRSKKKSLVREIIIVCISFGCNRIGASIMGH